jgi:hypothetical protein
MAACSLGCGRAVSNRSQFTECSVCRNNMAGWSLRPRGEAQDYVDTLELRQRRMSEITNATKESYIGQLKAKRSRRKA